MRRSYIPQFAFELTMRIANKLNSRKHNSALASYHYSSERRERRGSRSQRKVDPFIATGLREYNPQMDNNLQDLSKMENEVPKAMGKYDEEEELPTNP